MIRFNATLNADNVPFFTPAFERQINRKLRTIVRFHGNRVIIESRKSMRRAKSGLKHFGLRYRSSRIGETPRSQSGALAASIGIRDEGDTWVEIGSNVDAHGFDYGNFLELHRGRPLMEHGLYEVKFKFFSAVKDYVQQISGA